jgi:flagellar basal body rod protein FlgG
METSFNASLSGIHTYMTRQDIVGHDVANINTPGFEQRRVQQAELPGTGVSVTSITPVPNYSATESNTDFAEEAGEMITNKNGTAANVKALKMQDRMIGEVLDLIG